MSVYLIFTILTALSQENSGSIFDIISTPLSTADLAEQKSNLEANEPLSNINNITPTITLKDIQSSNQALKQEKSDLQQELDDASSKLAAYKQDQKNSELQAISIINQLEGINRQTQADQLLAAEQIKAEEAKKQDTSDSDDDDDDDDDDIEFATTLIIVISLGFIFLLLNGVRSILGSSIDSFLNSAFYSLFVDVTILLIIILVISIGFYINLFSDDVIDFSLLILGTALFTFFWLLQGLWLIVAAQAFSQVWSRHEKNCQDLRSLTHNFQDAQIEMAGGVMPKRLKAIYKDFQYAIMRQLFICPTYLPPVTETYLRTDFNLAEYLSRGLADVINKVFQLNWVGYSIVVASMILWRWILIFSDQGQFIALWCFPLVIVIVMLVLILKLRLVYNDLVPQPTDQIVLNLPRDNFGRSPDMNEDVIPKPDYLKGQLYSSNKETNYVNCCFMKIHPLKLTWAYFFTKEFPNRHELLFWADKYGVNIIISILQGISITLTLWITVILIYYIPVLYEDWKWIGILMIAACILTWIIAGCYLLPETLRILTLTCKVEMKKDKAIIECVVLNDRVEKSKIILRVYRQFKMIYRAKYGERPMVEDAVIKDYATEVFNMRKDPESQTVHIEELEDLIALCGVKLEDDEIRLFAKECRAENSEEITQQRFVDAILTLLASRNLRPEAVVKVVLNKYFKEGRGKNLKDVSLDEIKQFLNDFWWHFTEEDVEDFLWESRFVLEDIGTLDISELAGMVKNNVKEYAS